MSEASGRYQRSAAGMAGAMIATLLVIAAFVAFRAANRDELEVKPQEVDYLPMVAGFREGGFIRPVYPPELPDGWIATRAVFDPEHLAWELDLLTDDEKYVGLRQAAMSPHALVGTYVTNPFEPGGQVSLDGSAVTKWQRWGIEGDDEAVVGTFRRYHVMVFGSAGRDDIDELAGSLVAG